MEVLVVGNTAYVDDDFCAKAFPGDHVKVVAAAESRREESSPHASWNELLQHLEQAYEFDRVVYLSNFLTPHTDIMGDIELLRSVFRACMGRRVQLLYVAGPAGAEGAADASGRTGKGIIARAANDLCRHYAAHEGVQAKDSARALPLHCLRHAGGSVFRAAVRRVLNRIGRFTGLGGCGVSAAVCRGTCGAGAPYL